LALNTDVFDRVGSRVTVVEEQLFAFSNVGFRENTDSVVAIHADYFRSSVWVHRVIRKANFVALELDKEEDFSNFNLSCCIDAE